MSENTEESSSLVKKIILMTKRFCYPLPFRSYSFPSIHSFLLSLRKISAFLPGMV